MILNRLFDKLLRRKNPIQYWKKQGVKIGKGCSISPLACFDTEPYLIEIGDNVRINSGVQFVTHDGGVWVVRHMIDKYSDVDLFGSIKVSDNVHIGTNAIIMPNVKIGCNCVIGCGAIVTHDVPDNTVVAGIPARRIESIDEYFEKHKHEYLKTKHMGPKEKKEYLCSAKMDG